MSCFAGARSSRVEDRRGGVQESPSGSGNPGSHRELATRTRSPLARAPTIVHVPGAQRCRRVKNLGTKNSSWRSSLNLEAHTPPSPVGQFRTRCRETGISGCARSASSCPSRRQRDQARSVLILRTDLLLADQPLHGRKTREFRPAATSSLFLRDALGKIRSAHPLLVPVPFRGRRPDQDRLETRMRHAGPHFSARHLRKRLR